MWRSNRTFRSNTKKLQTHNVWIGTWKDIKSTKWTNWWDCNSPNHWSTISSHINCLTISFQDTYMCCLDRKKHETEAVQNAFKQLFYTVWTTAVDILPKLAFQMIQIEFGHIVRSKSGTTGPILYLVDTLARKGAAVPNIEILGTGIMVRKWIFFVLRHYKYSPHDTIIK